MPGADKLDRLYEEFFDPTDAFKKERRWFCYDIATELVKEARETSSDDWHDRKEAVHGVLLLLYTWNFAHKKSQQLTFDEIREVIARAKSDLQALDGYSITNADNLAWERIPQVFEILASKRAWTGASKALSLLNPRLFVMWDTRIRQTLNRRLIPGIRNGDTGDQYVRFLQGIQRIIREYEIEKKLVDVDVPVAKKIDEYNYVRIVMGLNAPRQL